MRRSASVASQCFRVLSTPFIHLGRLVQIMHRRTTARLGAISSSFSDKPQQATLYGSFCAAGGLVGEGDKIEILSTRRTGHDARRSLASA